MLFIVCKCGCSLTAIRINFCELLQFISQQTNCTLNKTMCINIQKCITVPHQLSVCLDSSMLEIQIVCVGWTTALIL